MEDVGIVYVATGRTHSREAILAAKKLRTFHSKENLSVSVITSSKHNRNFDRYCRKYLFNDIYELKNAYSLPFNLACKVEGICKPIYKRTLFLDTDTWVCDKLDPIFKLLDSYDVVIAPDPAEVEWPILAPYNTGVLGFNRNTNINNMLDKFKEVYYNEGPKLWKGHPAERQHTDQPAFMKALELSNVRLGVLTQNWNARYRFYHSLNPGKVKIIHGNMVTPEHFEQIRVNMNQHYERSRCWSPVNENIVMPM